MWMRKFLLVIGVVTGFASQNAVAQTEARLALVIGNSAYKASPLANPVNDARLMESALKEAGFTVLKAENAPIREMRRLIRDFGDRLKSSGGVGLFYYAGHGLQVRGENYLVSIDSDIRNEDEIADDAVNVNVVLEKMEGAGNRMNVIILDACRNNPFAVKSRSAVAGLATMNAPSGSIVAYATAPGSTASDGSGKNGLYTQHLARLIRQPGLPVEEVFKQVRASVRKDSSNKQTPWENTALEGQFYFKNPVAVAAPTPAPTPVAEARVSRSAVEKTPGGPSDLELTLWDSAKSATTTSELQAYLTRYPNGFFADLARAKMAAMDGTAADKSKVKKPATKPTGTDVASRSAATAAERAALDQSFWENVKGSQNPSEFKAYLSQFPTGTFAALAKARIEELAAAAKAPQKFVSNTQSTPPANESLGTLVITDTLSGRKRSIDIRIQESSAESTSYSSGDVIASDGKVLQVRIGDVLVQKVSGSLWSIPLVSGSSGEASIRRVDVDYDAPGTLSWRVVDVGDGRDKVEARIKYLVIGANNMSSVTDQAQGKWTAVYRAGLPVPDSFSSTVSGRTTSSLNTVSAELKAR